MFALSMVRVNKWFLKKRSFKRARKIVWENKSLTWVNQCSVTSQLYFYLKLCTCWGSYNLWSDFESQCFYSLALQSCFLFKNKNMKRGREEKKQYGSACSITIWCSMLRMNNLLLKNYIKNVHHSDLFISLFDLNSLSLHYICRNGVCNNWKRCENVNLKWFSICFPGGTIKQSSVLEMWTVT